MSIYLEILETPDLKLKGQIVEIFAGLKIGRREGQLVLQDAHLSGLHAVVEEVGQNRFALVDQDSHNGILLNGRQVKRVFLLPDVVFFMGQTSFKVVVQHDSILDVSALVSWQERLRENLRRFLRSIDREKDSEIEGQLRGLEVPLAGSEDLPLGPYYQTLVPFPFCINLLFTRGPQAETSWVLGYGPRRAGFKHFDLPLSEAQIPDELFEIRANAQSQKIEIICFDTEIIKINGRGAEKTTVKHGDALSFGQSEILIEVLGEHGF